MTQHKKRDITKNFCRERQFSPKKCHPDSFRVITTGAKKRVICCKKGKYDIKEQKCKEGTRVQSILSPNVNGKCSN